jgi:hypothetical protein
MDQQTADRLAALILPAINAVLKAHGFEATRQRGTFDAHTFNARVQIKATGTDLDKVAFEKYAFAFGLKASDHGRTVTTTLGEARVVSLNPKARRYPVTATLPNGRQIGLPREALEQLKKKAETPRQGPRLQVVR